METKRKVASGHVIYAIVLSQKSDVKIHSYLYNQTKKAQDGRLWLMDLNLKINY